MRQLAAFGTCIFDSGVVWAKNVSLSDFRQKPPLAIPDAHAVRRIRTLLTISLDSPFDRLRRRLFPSVEFGQNRLNSSDSAVAIFHPTRRDESLIQFQLCPNAYQREIVCHMEAHHLDEILERFFNWIVENDSNGQRLVEVSVARRPLQRGQDLSVEAVPTGSSGILWRGAARATPSKLSSAKARPLQASVNNPLLYRQWTSPCLSRFHPSSRLQPA